MCAENANAALREQLNRQYSHALYDLEPDVEPFAQHSASQVPASL